MTTPPETSAEAPPATRVLCVDDNREAADAAAEFFRLCGCEAKARYRGEDAVVTAMEFRPSVCFIDLDMPLMGGDEVARRIAALSGGRRVLLVALTGADDPAARRRISLAGFHLHLVKPADPEVMFAIVKARPEPV